MIYILVITAIIIINFTNGISKLQNKKYTNDFENFILENYKVLFGVIFTLFFLGFWRYSCFFLGFNC